MERFRTKQIGERGRSQVVGSEGEREMEDDLKHRFTASKKPVFRIQWCVCSITIDVFIVCSWNWRIHTQSVETYSRCNCKPNSFGRKPLPMSQVSG